jgi:hypothetical protein
MHEHFVIIVEYEFSWSEVKCFYKAKKESQMSDVANFLLLGSKVGLPMQGMHSAAEAHP